jgi:hypothetical protein
MKCGIPDWIVEQERDMCGKTGEIQIKSRINNILVLVSVAW